MDPAPQGRRKNLRPGMQEGIMAKEDFLADLYLPYGMP